MLSVYIWIPLAPEKTTESSIFSRSWKQSHMQFLPCLPPHAPSSPPPPRREARLWAGKCWRMCSGSRGRVSQGHSIICVGNLQALHSQQFPFRLPLSPWDGTAVFPNTPRLPFRHLPAKLEGGCCKPVLAVWSVPCTGTAGLALEAGSLWNWPIRDS